MLPRLEAEEAMHMANQIAVGSGTLEKASHERVRAAWETAARPPSTTRSRRPAAATPDVLVGMGIGYRVVPKTTP